MICPDCGTENPEGSAFCSNCSATLGGGGGFRLATPSGSTGGTQSTGGSPYSSNSPYSGDNSVNDALFGGGMDSTFRPAYPPDSLAPVPKKGGLDKNWIAVIIAIVVLAAAVIGAGYTVLGWQYNGTYELESIEMKQGDQEYSFSVAQLEALSGESFKCALKISFGKGTLTLDSSYNSLGLKTYRGRVKFSGTRVLFPGDKAIEGVYDKKNKTISVSMDEAGVTMTLVFKKK